MIIKAYFGKPGTKRNLKKNGIIGEAEIDPSLPVSYITRKLYNKIYSPKERREHDITKKNNLSLDFLNSDIFLLDVGLVTGSGIIYSTNNIFLLSHDENSTIGQNILSPSELLVTFNYKTKEVVLQKYNWESFEDEIAAIYRSLGGVVKQNVNKAGFQIDMIVEEITPSNQKIRIAVECKYYKDKVGNKIVNDFSRIIATLQHSKLIDKGVIVSSSGFTQDASLVAENNGIELITKADLEQLMSDSNILHPTIHEVKNNIKVAKSEKRIKKSSPIGFIIMPFSSEYDDLYHLGIREVINDFGASCERADEMQFTGGIIQKILHSIQTCDFIIAEISEQNPNVYYEIGYAHAINKPVILLTKNVTNTPFDVRGYNHLIYSNIIDLRKKLKTIVASIINVDS